MNPLCLAALVSLAVHFCAFLFLPEHLFESVDTGGKQRFKPIDFSWDPPQVIDPLAQHYVEVNPVAAENKPDQAAAYSFKDQQAAGESGEEPDTNRPQLAGEVASKKLTETVQAALDQVAPPSLPSLVSLVASQSEADSLTVSGKLSQTALPPLPEFLTESALSETASGVTLQQPVEPTEPTNQVLELPVIELHPIESSLKPLSEAVPEVPAEQRPQPSARPRLAPELLAGPQMQSNGGRVRRGTLAIDATFTEFGEYEQQFYSALQAGWYQEIDFFQPIDTATRVVVQFVLQADGGIREIEVLASNASRIASLLCQNALKKRAPFRVWTREMEETFGAERRMKVVFHYR